MSKQRLQDIAVIGGVLFMCSIPVWMGIGKWQLCTHYFPEMTRMACFFTQLPAVNTNRK
jgi:Na+/glutamate symporter